MGIILPQLGVSSHIFGKTRLVDRHLELYQKHDIKNIEISLRDGCLDIYDPKEILRVKQAVSKFKLRVNTIHPEGGIPDTGFWLADKDRNVRKKTIDYHKRMLEIGEFWGASFLILEHESYPYWPFWDQSNEKRIMFSDSEKYWLESLDSIIDYSKNMNISIVLENIDGFSCERLVEIVKSYHQKSVGICLDICHLTYEKDRFDKLLEQLAAYTLTTHISDNFFLGNIKWNDLHLIPFDGHIDWRQVLLTIYHSGYEGCLILEVINSEYDITSRVLQAIEHIKNIVSSM